MIQFHKNCAVKFLDPKSTLIPLLLADGWVAEGAEPATEAPRRGRPPKEKEVTE